MCDAEGERAARRHERKCAEERDAAADAHEADGPLVARALVEMDAHLFTLAGIELGVRVRTIAVIVAAVDDERQVGNDGDSPRLCALERDAQRVVGIGRCVEHGEERQIARRLHAEQILSELLECEIAAEHLAASCDTQLVERAECDDARVRVDESAWRVEHAHVASRRREPSEWVRAVLEIDRPSCAHGAPGARREGIEQERIANEAQVRDHAVDRHACGRGRKSKCAIAQRGVSAVHGRLPASSHMRTAGKLSTQLVEQERTNGQCGE